MQARVRLTLVEVSSFFRKAKHLTRLDIFERSDRVVGNQISWEKWRWLLMWMSLKEWNAANFKSCVSALESKRTARYVLFKLSSRAIHNKECSSCEFPLVYAKMWSPWSWTFIYQLLLALHYSMLRVISPRFECTPSLIDMIALSETHWTLIIESNLDFLVHWLINSLNFSRFLLLLSLNERRRRLKVS